MATQQQLEALRQAVEETQKARIIRMCGRINGNELSYPATLRTGRKYIKLDVGNSGKYMIETATDKVYGIKGYGVIHRGHYYGTVEEFTQQLQASLTA